MRKLSLPVTWTVLLLAASVPVFGQVPYPRLAAYCLACPIARSEVQKQLARDNVAIVTVWPGWETTYRTTLDQVIQNIKAINPNTLVFDYIKNNEIDGSAATNRAYAELFDKLDSMRWYLYPIGTSGTPVRSSWPGATELNSTLFTAKDPSGLNWVDWFAGWAVGKYYKPNPRLDGFFLDNVFWQPRVTGDWNVDGMPDSIRAAAPWLRQGNAEHFRYIRTLMPGKLQLGNIADLGHPNAEIAEYQGQMDGGFIEGLIGYSWSVETWGGWQAMMTWYRKAMSVLGTAKLGLFGQIGSPTDYQAFRYGFASCLMDDGYFVFNSSSAYNDAPAFDEYAVALGKAISSPSVRAWQNGVYRRDFQNGIALVNPKGNGPQTVTLETAFKRISGGQAPSVNTGQNTTTVTLNDRDGLILLRLKPSADSAAPANVTADK